MKNSVLASYATFKELYNSHKYSSPYQILSEFVQYVIVSKGLYAVGIDESKKDKSGEAVSLTLTDFPDEWKR